MRSAVNGAHSDLQSIFLLTAKHYSRFTKFPVGISVQLREVLLRVAHDSIKQYPLGCEQRAKKLCAQISDDLARSPLRFSGDLRQHAEEGLINAEQVRREPSAALTRVVTCMGSASFEVPTEARLENEPLVLHFSQGPISVMDRRVFRKVQLRWNTFQNVHSNIRRPTLYLVSKLKRKYPLAEAA